MITEYSGRHEAKFASAVEAMREDVDNGTSFQGALEHYSLLYGISEDALRHEWNLREEDDQ